MLVLTATQKCALTFAVVDAKGNPASVEGVPVWDTSDPSKITVDASTDGMTATANAVGPLTTTPVQVSVTADADLGEGTRAIVGLLDLTVVAGEAVSVNISAGTPEEQAAKSAKKK